VKTPIFRHYISKSSVSKGYVAERLIFHISVASVMWTHLIYLSCVLIHIRPLYMMQTTNIRKRMLEKKTIFMNWNPFWKKIIVAQLLKIYSPLWNSNVHCHFHKPVSGYRMLNHLKTLHTVTPCFLRSDVTRSSHLRLDFHYAPFPWYFSIKLFKDFFAFLVYSAAQCNISIVDFHFR